MEDSVGGVTNRTGPALSERLRWPLAKATSQHVFNFVNEISGDLASDQLVVDASHERHIRSRFRLLGHPTLLKYSPDQAAVYVRAVRRAHLALRVAAATNEDDRRVEFSNDQVPTLRILSTGSQRSLVTPLDVALWRADTIDEQVNLVARWASKEFEACVRRGWISSPSLIFPSRLRPLNPTMLGHDVPQIGIQTGLHGLTVMWVLESLKDPSSVGACKTCGRPFIRIRGRRREFCDSSCRGVFHRQGRPPQGPG